MFAISCQFLPALSAICLIGYMSAHATIFAPRFFSCIPKSIFSNTFDACNNATQPHATTHSSIAALVALSASSIRNFFSFNSTSEAAHTFIIATPQSNFAILSEIWSFANLESVCSNIFCNSPTLCSISDLSHFHPIIVVFS
jgi:hypothetical protein